MSPPVQKKLTRASLKKGDVLEADLFKDLPKNAKRRSEIKFLIESRNEENKFFQPTSKKNLPPSNSSTSSRSRMPPKNRRTPRYSLTGAAKKVVKNKPKIMLPKIGTPLSNSKTGSRSKSKDVGNTSSSSGGSKSPEDSPSSRPSNGTRRSSRNSSKLSDFRHIKTAEESSEEDPVESPKTPPNREESSESSSSEDGDDLESSTTSEEDDEEDAENDDDEEEDSEGEGGRHRSLRNFSGHFTPKQIESTKVNQMTPSTPKAGKTPSQNDVVELARTPNSESYFRAKKKLIFRKERATKPKKANQPPSKRRKFKKLDQTENEKRPVAPERRFASITKEMSRVYQKYNENFDPRAYLGAHQPQIESLLQNVKDQFPKWVFLMREGFNIVLYGYGSKLPIVEAFEDYLKEDFIIITLNGLSHKLSPKKFLTDFFQCLEIEPIKGFAMNESNIARCSDELYDLLKDKKLDDVFIIIKNFDELAFAQPTFVTILSTLASLDFVHLLATTDHINAFIGVDFNSLISLNFQWFDTTTFIPYDEELRWKPQVFGEKDLMNTAKNTFEHVLKSLTQNSKKAFKVLAEAHLDQMKGEVVGNKEVKVKGRPKKKGEEVGGVGWRELLRKCQEKFIAHHENSLKTLLQEFFDHNLIHYEDKGRSKGGEKRILIDLDRETLEEFVANF